MFFLCVSNNPENQHKNFYMGKNIVKGATQGSEHFLKLYFCMFEISQGKHNNLNCYKSFWNIFY
jgi:hypothetical protein